jgi:hypothetical protein
MLFFNFIFIFWKCHSLIKSNSKLYKKIRIYTSVHSYVSDNIARKVESTSAIEEKMNFEATLSAISSDEEFQEFYWQKKPLLIQSELKSIVSSFTMVDVKASIEEEFLEAGRGSFEDGRTGWNMAMVSKPRGKSFEEAKLNFDDVVAAMKQTNGFIKLFFASILNAEN